MMEPRRQRVSLPEWWLASLTFVLGVGSAFSRNYEFLVGVLWLILPLNALLVVITTRRAFRDGSVGRALLVGATFIFFWLDAAVLAAGETPFAPNSLSIGTSQFSAATVGRAYFHIALFEVMLLAGYSWHPRLRGIVAWTACRVDRRAVRSSITPSVMAALIFVPLLVESSFVPSAAVASLLQSRSQGGTALGYEASSYGMNMLYYVGMYGTAFLFVRAAVFADKRWRCAALAAVCTVPIILSGARHLVLYVALPLLAVALSNLGRSTGRRPYTRVLLLALAIVVIGQVQLILRPIGFDQASAVAPSQLLETDISGQFSALLFAEFLVPDMHDYFFEPMEPYFIVHFVPRAIWRSKPEMRTQRFFDDSYTQGVRGTNYTPTAIGQYYMSWGVLGVAAIGLWIGVLGRTADRLFAAVYPPKQVALSTAIGMFYAFIISSFRIYSPYYFAFFVVGGAASVIASRRWTGFSTLLAEEQFSREA